jgi:hypothetical protein
MAGSPIVIEERLRSGALAGALGVVAALGALRGITAREGSGAPKGRSASRGARVLASVFLAALAVGFSRIVARVVETADGRAFEVIYGPGGMVRQTFAASQIERANARRIGPMTAGGWGYRGSLTLLRRAALVTRRGEALELHLRGGRRFVVTLDDAADFASALSLS